MRDVVIEFASTPTTDEVLAEMARARATDDLDGVTRESILAAIRGYANLVEILGDPGHPDHDDQLEWLGLDSADEFDPSLFDAPAVNGMLARLR